MRAIVVVALLSFGQIHLALAQQPDPARERIRRMVVPPQVVTRTQLPPNVVAAITKSDAVIVGSSVAAAAPTTPTVDSAQVVSPAATSFMLHRGQFLAAAIDGPAIVVKKPDALVSGDTIGVNSFIALPERFVGLAADSDIVFLRPAYLPQGRLRYVPSLTTFRAVFSIGLEDSVRSRERRDLSGPFRFQFGGDEADSFDPRELDVNHTNLPLDTVMVFAKDPADSLLVRIVTAADVRGTSVWIRAVPALALGLLPGTAQGLGLQRIPVSVSLLGTRKPMWVHLSTDKGSFDSDSVLVGSGKITTVSWRTQGLGSANILAHAEGGVDDAPGRVKFIFPFVFLIAAVLGGAAGAALRSLGRTGRSKRPVMPAIAIGILAGVVSAVLYYAIGVSIFKVDVDVPFFNEAAVFSLAVLAGLLGLSLTGRTSSA